MVMNRRAAMAGLSLVELMVALVISLVLMLGVVQVFIASQTAARLSEGASRVQENARFALDFLERDIRMAGHMGCVNDQAHVSAGFPRVHPGLRGARDDAGREPDAGRGLVGSDRPAYRDRRAHPGTRRRQRRARPALLRAGRRAAPASPA
ncbi:hypothetical protein G6F59_015225 [Rhizopus arrhizus]|nr:hypothetical protein G6F59_015225 [Rhizopus arrhizus]